MQAVAGLIDDLIQSKLQKKSQIEGEMGDDDAESVAGGRWYFW